MPTLKRRSEPKWFLLLRAAHHAAMESARLGGLSIFGEKGFGKQGRRLISQLVALQLASPVWSIKTTGEVEYMVTRFGREVLGVAQAEKRR